MKFRVTEHTIRQDLLKSLELDLEDLSLAVFDELSFVTPSQIRRIPDIVILKQGEFFTKGDAVEVAPGGVVCIVETKKMEIAEGMAQVGQYQSLLRKSHGASRFVASTDFQKLYIHDEKTGHYLLKDFESSAAISEEIKQIVKEGLTVGTGELNEEEYVKSLKASVEFLNPFTRRIDKTVTERLTGIFLARTLDSEIGKNPKISEEVTDTSKKAASFILVNQLFFYHILSGSEESIFPPISLPTELEVIETAFAKVRERDFESIYAARIIDLLGKDSEETINGIIEQMKLLKVGNISSDIIGKVFHELIPFQLRKRIAAYYTGNSAAHLLSLLCIDNPDGNVADFACGSGTMLVESYKRIKSLSKGNLTEGCGLHFRILSQLYGFDITLFAGQLAAMNLFIQNLACFPELVKIAIDDAFHLRPSSQEILPVQETVRTDFVTTSGRIELPKSFQSILINPPFTDRRRITSDYIHAVDEAMKSLKRFEYVKGQFHLGLYFILLCEAFLDKNGMMGVVIPETVLGNVALKGFRKFLIDKFYIFAIITSTAQISFSHNCDWKEVLLVLKKGKAKPGEKTRIVTLANELSYEEGDSIAKMIKEGRVTESSKADVSISLFEDSEFDVNSNWLRLLRPESALDFIESVSEDMLRSGIEVFRGNK